MAFQINVRADVKAVQRKLGILSENVRDQAIASALNDTIAKGKTQMSREIGAEYNLPARTIKERLSITRAKRSGFYALTASLTGSAKRRGRRAMNVIAFLTTKGAAKRRKAGDTQLRFKIKRTGAPKIIRGSFIGNQGRTVFIREGAARLPIKAVTTGDIPQMFNQKSINRIVRTTMERDFATILERRMRYYIARFNA